MTQPICARSVLWRSLLFPLLYGLIGAGMVSLVFRAADGEWAHNLGWVLAGAATGLVLGLLLTWSSLPLELDAQGLHGPSRWGRSAVIPLDEIDWRPELQPGFFAWFLGQRVVVARHGSRKVLIDRWRYRPAEVRPLLAELDRLTGEHLLAADQTDPAGS